MSEKTGRKGVTSRRGVSDALHGHGRDRHGGTAGPIHDRRVGSVLHHGNGAKNKVKYLEHGVKAVFQGGESGEVADVFFHGTANYEKGLGVDYLKLTSCNTTGLIRAVDAIHQVVGVSKTFITIVRRVADPGDTHRGLTNVLQVDPIPNHQAVDLMHRRARLTRHVDEAEVLLAEYRDRIAVPVDVAAIDRGQRREIAVADLPTDTLIVDVGEATISAYEVLIAAAGTVFVNGPAGVYEHAGADVGTRRLWAAVAAAPGMTAIGGGDTVASAKRFVDLDDIGFVSTAGGALIRFVSGQPLPLLEASR